MFLSWMAWTWQTALFFILIVLALTCMCEGITPLEFSRTYHIISGRPAMRADILVNTLGLKQP
ncbi:MAG: hypothetical protein ACPHP9_07050, partial [bacterium]